MSTYLPKESGGGSAFQEGGGLYALGLIHANHGRGQIMEYLHDQLSNATSEVKILEVFILNGRIKKYYCHTLLWYPCGFHGLG